MTPAVTVLLSSAGRRVGLMECFRRDAAELGIKFRIIAIDMRPDFSAACALSDAAFRVPPCGQPEYIPFLRSLCQREGVDLLIPTIDTELSALALLRHDLHQIGTRVIVSTSDVVDLARDKWRTATELPRLGIRTPRTAKVAEFDADGEGWEWPLILKPVSGSSSIGVQIVARDELRNLALDENLIVQERLVGQEYTINLFFDQAGVLRCAIPHLRVETRAGEVSKGETARNGGLQDMALRLGKVLSGARGPLCFQAIVDSSGIPTLFEINARFGGGFPLAHKSGARFSRWLLEEAAGLPSSANDDWQSGIRMLRYDAAVFL
jgi:carbamoyl-phosphate synthase large subunit